MSKIQFCYEFFRYISNGFTVLTFTTDNLVYSFDFDKDDIFISQDYFTICNEYILDKTIKYSELKSISA